MERGTEVLAGATLVAEHCCNCGVLFGLDASHRAELLRNPGTRFYCPNGHPQHYTGTSDKQRAERAEAKLAQERARFDQRLAAEHDRIRALQASRSATQGVVTRIKNRVSRGVCPCCNRTFENLARHMVGQHPAWKGSSPDERRPAAL